MSIMRRLVVGGRLSVRGFAESKESPLRGMLRDAAAFEEKDRREWATSPYPDYPEGDRPDAPLADPRETAVLLFPGQGTQFVGMGADLLKYPSAKRIYECASEVVGVDLAKISSKEELDRHCQVAVVTASLACVERLRDERPSAVPACVGAAGFSLGEITALIFAGAIGLEAGLQLVNVRALAMEAASKARPGGMTTVHLAPDARVKDLLRDARERCETDGADSTLAVANDLFPQCKVLAGSEAALRFVSERGRPYGIKSARRLDVAGAFHTEMMRDAVEPFRRALKVCPLSEPRVPVYSGATCRLYRSVDAILALLPKQIVTPVKWEQLMHFVYARDRGAHFPRTYECGPGNSLRQILRKVNGPAWDSSASIRA